MLFLKKHKKFLVITAIVISSLVLLILIAQFILGNILQNRLEDSLSSSEKKDYKISVGNVKVNLFTMTLILKDVQIEPDSSFINQIKLQKWPQKKAFRINIPNLRVRYIGVISFIADKYVDVGSFVIKNAKVDLLTSGKSDTPKPKSETKSTTPFNVDSIKIKGISGVNLDKFLVKNFGLNVIDIKHNDTVFRTKSLNIRINNIALVKNDSDSISFRLMLKEFDFRMSDERFELPGGKYLLSFDDMRFNMNQSQLVFKKLKIVPKYSQSRMVELSEFQYEIYNCEIEKVEVNSLYPLKIIKGSKIFISDVLVDNMKLRIFKDKRRPFDTEKRPKLPQELLKSMKQELYIDSININNSELIYAERHDMMEEPMIVTLGKLNVKVKDITSIFDSINKGTVMTIRLLANLQKKIPMGVNIYFPMRSVADTFSFNGWLGNGNLELFNNVTLPAIGVKFKSGYLDGLSFKARANPTYSMGEMTMLYHDLNGIVVRKDMKKTNKFLSWAANQIINKNNPAKNKDNRIEPMYFNRVMYKGLGNFLWKTLQTGILGTIIPGMDNKPKKEINTTLGTDKKDVRKRKREEKKKRDKNNK